MQTIILASSVLYELIGPACAKLSLYLSGAYADTSPVEEAETEAKVSEMERLIAQIQQIQKELPAHVDVISEEERAFDEAAEEQYATLGHRRPNLRFRRF